MENEVLHLKVNSLIHALQNKGLILDGELEIINKSVVDTAQKCGHQKEEVERYLGID